MENTEEIREENKLPTLIVTEEMRSHFYEMAKWANFLAVVGFVFSGFMIVGAFTVGAAMNSSPEVAAMVGKMSNLGGPGFTILCLIYAFAIFYPSLLLFKYASQAKQGVLYGHQESLQEAMGKLKALFKYWGILTILFVALMVFSALMGPR